jgi:diadenosine tetraphosphate (Ap4A) HIT family hydrolase
MNQFKIAPELQNDCHMIVELMFSSLMLLDDSRFLWFILVPKRPMLEEIYDMSPEEQQILFAEVSTLGKILRTKFAADKVNVASFGNVVKQLHIHVIGRYKTDDAWPKPVWCASTEKIPYAPSKIAEIKKIIAANLPR